MTTDAFEDLSDLEPSARLIFEAVLAMTSHVDQRTMLERITRSACELSGARYGAFGLVGSDGGVGDLITYGHQAEPPLRVVGKAAGRRARLDVEPDSPPSYLRGEIPDTVPPGLASGSPFGSSAAFAAGPDPLQLLTRRAPLGGGAHALRTGDRPERQFLEVPVLVQGQHFGQLYLADKVGDAAFTIGDEHLVTAYVRAAGRVIECSTSFGLSERRRRWLEAAADLTGALTPPLEQEVALQVMCDTALPLMQAVGVAAGTRVEHGKISGVAADPGHEDRVRKAADQVPDRIVRRLVEPLDLEIDDLYAVVVPVRSSLAGRGALVAFYDLAKAAHDADERELFIGFAAQAALALDRLRAVEDRADLAVITDRERIARDLHDTVIQRLFATGLQLEALGRNNADAELADKLSEAVDALDQTIKDVRGTIFDLNNHDVGSLRAQVREVVREYADVMSFAPKIRINGPVDTAVPDTVRSHLLPVLREAVSNLARHAQAHTAEIELSLQDDELKLVVRDDGQGLPEDTAESGLKNARSRAIQLGGQLDVGPCEPTGTEFVWQVPLSN